MSMTNRQSHVHGRQRLLIDVLIGGIFCISAITAHTDVLDGLEFSDLAFEPPSSERVDLTNGMKLFLMPDDELPIFDLVAYVLTGDIEDPADKIGLARLAAHVMRTGGTTSWPPDKLNEELEYIAGAVESSMSLEHATVSLSVMSKDTDFGLELFADVLINPAFDPEKFELARNQSIEGIRRQNDNPNQIASRNLRQLVHGEHPYGNVATIASLESVTRDDLIAFHTQYYRPDAMWLAISGDFDRQHVIERLESLFADWTTSGEAAVSSPGPHVAGSHGVYHAEKELNQTAIWMGHVGIRRTNPDWFALRVMNEILGGSGFTSRMMREIRSNRGLAYVVQTWFQRPNERGMFLAASGTKPSSTVETMELMLDMIREIREEPVTDAELDLATNSIINSFIFAYTSSAQIAEQDLRIEFFGYPPDYLRTYQDKIANVATEDVLRVSQEYLHPDELTIVTVGQRALFDMPLDTLGPVTEIDLDSDAQ